MNEGDLIVLGADLIVMAIKSVVDGWTDADTKIMEHLLDIAGPPASSPTTTALT